MSSLSTTTLLPIFIAASAVTWLAGTSLSKATDSLDFRFSLGQALSGLVLLGFATSLPELAIVVSGAANGHYDIVVGNLIGGIAIQTFLIALLDARAGGERPLSFLVGSLTLVIEAGTVVAVGAIALGGTQIPASVNLIGVSPASALLVLAWILGLLAVRRMQSVEPWKASAPGSHAGRRRRTEKHPQAKRPFKGRSTAFVVVAFALGSLLTLIAGYALEESGNALAARAGLSSGIFGATVLALVTALPGVSTGFAAIALGDYAMSMSEMFGGNAFAPALFIFADLIAGSPTVVHAQSSDIYMAALGVAMTSIFIAGIIVRPTRKRLRMGPDSWLVIGAYVLGIAGLATIPGATG